MNGGLNAAAFVLLALTASSRSDARQPPQCTSQTVKPGALMSKEFEKLEALLDLSEPSDRDPQVDREEAAKLAARWGWLLRRARDERVERPQTRRPQN